MFGALRVLWRGLMQFERYGPLFVLANITSVALSLPIVTAPAAFAGLVRLCYKAQTDHTTTFSEFWEGFRAAFWRGLIVGGLNVVVIGVLVVNFFTYSAQSSSVFLLLRAVWGIILIGWLGVQLYLWPMLAAMESPTLIGGFRNAALMFSLNPVFTLTLLAVLGLVLVLSTILRVPWLLLTLAFLASVATAAVRDRLALAAGKPVDQPDREDLRGD